MFFRARTAERNPQAVAIEPVDVLDRRAFDAAVRQIACGGSPVRVFARRLRAVYPLKR